MFNHQARWDRDLPQDKDRKSGAPISVLCLMDKGQIIPKSFLWRNRTFDITKVNFRWKDKQGRETRLFFSIQTGEGTYEIAFSSESLSWRLNKLLGP